MRLEVLLAILFIQIVWSQNTSEKLVHGKIITTAENAEGINIINLSNQKSTISDSNGAFSILAKEKDSLVFSSIHLEYYVKKIENKDLNSELLLIHLKSKVTELKEVIIHKYPEINAISLGISRKGIKKYTPAERRLKAAEELHWYSPLLIPLGGMSVDGMINSISGRTTMLKKELEIEKKERRLVYLESLFKKEHYIETLKIPPEYVKGFLWYCVEDEIFTNIMKTKNSIQIEFALLDLAKKYNQIISDKS